MLVCNILLWRMVVIANTLTIPNANAATAVKKLTTPVSALAKNSALPLRLRIASIGVNAPIEAVGLGADGAMGTPKIPSDTAWYMLGPKPGETGSAVIAGHVNWWNGATSAFARLANIKVGDVIAVQDDLGAITTFTVAQIKRYDVTADPTNVFISTDGNAHLNLVTCIGTWNKRTKQYNQRLVVFADKSE